ncbi:MAG TPA: hypothetical protein VJU61_26605 [Polyangiaceae bacterium]|nr:hypothetical protein [Polyangiaceae bacterium]
MHTLLDEQYRDRKTGHSDPNAKLHMFVNHYWISSGMMSLIVGLGAKYAAATATTCAARTATPSISRRTRPSRSCGP